MLSAHHALRSAAVPCAEEPEPEPNQLSLFIPRGQLELPAITTLLHAQFRDAAPSRLLWMKLLARVFRIDIPLFPTSVHLNAEGFTGSYRPRHVRVIGEGLRVKGGAS